MCVCVCVYVQMCHTPSERHQVLLEELEMLVDPVLHYRHSGVYDAHRYSICDNIRDAPQRYLMHDASAPAPLHHAGDDDMRGSVEGSSVVFVNPSDALNAEGLEASQSACPRSFSLLAAKVTLSA